MTTRIGFHGAANTVTGSKYLLESGSSRVLVDCGLFQGYKNLRLRNRSPLPFDPTSLDAVILTHAHLDHSGYLPVLMKSYRGPVYCTEATRDLCQILLSDSGHLQERDAEIANRRRSSKHKSAEPLYTQAEGEAAAEHLTPLSFGQDHEIGDGMRLHFDYAGHILGAAIVSLNINGQRWVFSGDLGRHSMETMHDPAHIEQADYIVVESTYGNRRHPKEDAMDVLASTITRTIKQGGTVLIPAFAVGRTQSLLYLLYTLKREQRIPDVPVYLDSPMAINASEIFCRHAKDHRLSDAEARAACGAAIFTRDVRESMALDDDRNPKIILSASGMATGGRVLHHLKQYAPDPSNLILFTGFQAGGTRGARLVNGEDTVKLFGEIVPVKATVSNLEMLSAHADSEGLLQWLQHFRSPPRRCFVTHGEPEATDTLRYRIQQTLGWQVDAPELGQVIELEH